MARLDRSDSRGRAAVTLLSVSVTVLVALLGAATPATARELYWSSMEVQARLDDEGRLHVVERQTMVFDGDWNGGERRFDVRPGQDLELRAVRRVDPETGVVRELERGDLDRVDHWDWTGGDVLRWRSRLPSDPPFASETITYVLDYVLGGVLKAEGDRYRLNHDFSFPDRYGMIERFVLDLELDPVWQALDPLPPRLELEDLLPGRGVVLTATLSYRGDGRPGAVRRAVPFSLRLAIVLASFLAMAWLYRDFRRHEAAHGRYDPPAIPTRPDRAWLAEHLLDLRAELVGALWDRRVGPPEVAATLARLVSEGKLASSVREEGKIGKKKVLELELLVDRDVFQGYERKLIDKLFFGKRTKTDTEAVRKHYKKRGFSPAALIRGPIAKRLRQRLEKPPERPKSRRTLILFAAFVLCLLLEAIMRGKGIGVLIAIFLPAMPLPLIIGTALAFWYRKWVRNLFLGSLGFLLPALLLAFVYLLAVLGADAIVDFYPSVFGLLALAIFPVMVLSFWLNAARTRDARSTVHRRQILGAIRRHFAVELQRPRPDLEDDWFPYLVAFGLHRQMDGWFKSFGGESAGRTASYGGAAASTTFGGSSSSPSWSGGGGAFGGAGATASWGLAAATLGAGVAAPSSSGSGGGGGGGGGGSSGGGGGGGW